MVIKQITFLLIFPNLIFYNGILPNLITKWGGVELDATSIPLPPPLSEITVEQNILSSNLYEVILVKSYILIFDYHIFGHLINMS